MNRAKRYFYLHDNGELIYKNATIVDCVGPHNYFESDLVKFWFHVTNNDTKNYKEGVIKSLEGHNLTLDAIKVLSEKYSLNLFDEESLL